MRVRAALLAALLLGGCATTHDRVILLPNAGGGAGKVAVLEDGGKQTVISEPYSTARVDHRGMVETTVLDEATVREEYAIELAGLPPRPTTYNLFFRPDSPLLTAESEAESVAIFDAIAQRPAVEVVLVGHSDTRGDDEHNQQLSMTRAMLVRARLISRGVSGFRVTITGKGERHPIVPTPDDVEEPRNRRVEMHAR